MRARNIKPALFKNEHLGQEDPIYTLLFIGLWCMADRAGRLEDRPIRIQAEIFPYRGDLGIDQALHFLNVAGFIIRYQVNNSQYIQILNFEKHQHCHVQEKQSTIPAPDLYQTNPSSSLIPDLLKSDLLNTASCKPFSDEYPKEFMELKSIFPSRKGSQSWRGAFHAAKARLREGHSWEKMIAGAKRYAEFVRDEGSEGTVYVKQAKTFLGPEMFFNEEWSTGKSDPSEAF